MKQQLLASAFALFCALATSVTAQQPDPRQLGVLDEKVSRLNAQIEDLQFRQQQTQKDLERIQTELQELRRTAGGVAPGDLKALEDRITAVDAARQKDKQAIIDQLAKELASIGSSKSSKTELPATGTKEHIVQKGETLTIIAKVSGVTVADLKKANNLTGDDIKVGQKLVIPR